MNHSPKPHNYHTPQAPDEFSYTYSASRQEEIKRIRQKYLPEEADKMERLRALDASVTQKSTLFSLIVGILSALILGVGMCCILVWDLFALGILVGLVGIGGVAAAYPTYLFISERARARVAPEIIKLTDELLK